MLTTILLGGIIVPFLILELIFRCLPVSDRVEFMPVNDQHPYLHAKPHQVYRLTQGNLFQIQAVKRTNNEGFFCDLDFQPGDTSPRVAVIGDSFVEALQVANADAIHARLDSLLPPRWSVYGIGSSGSALPQYLAYARYAIGRLKPQALVFVIYQNDFTESLAGVAPVAGHHYFSKDGMTIRYDRPTESLWRRLVYESALFRYLWLNVKLPRFFKKSTNRSKPAVQNMDTLPARITHQFISGLKEVAGTIPVWLVTDAPRPAVYARQWETASSTHPVAKQYAFLRQQAQMAGFHTVDLAPAFRKDFLTHRQRFEFPTDGHWNPLGHRLAAEALATSMLAILLPPYRQKARP